MKEEKEYYEACLKRIDNNLKNFYQILLNLQGWHQNMAVSMAELEMKVDKLCNAREVLSIKSKVKPKKSKRQ